MPQRPSAPPEEAHLDAKIVGNAASSANSIPPGCSSGFPLTRRIAPSTLLGRPDGLKMHVVRLPARSKRIRLRSARLWAVTTCHSR
ncbi:hypothetical protein X963_5676 [Burkholderia pseudomallei MSHR7498]|nr:hypothetical protein X963_5676 [Burkholderia pseudomallei MSHR7498]